MDSLICAQTASVTDIILANDYRVGLVFSKNLAPAGVDHLSVLYQFDHISMVATATHHICVFTINHDVVAVDTIIKAGNQHIRGDQGGTLFIQGYIDISDTAKVEWNGAVIDFYNGRTH